MVMCLIKKQNYKIINKNAYIIFPDGGGNIRAGAGAAE